MPFALDTRSDSFRELILTFYSPKRILQSIRSIRLNSLPAIILPIYFFFVCVCFFCVQRAQTGRGKFISNINDHIGLKPTASIVTIATRQ